MLVLCPVDVDYIVMVLILWSSHTLEITIYVPLHNSDLLSLIIFLTNQTFLQ
jgi:hypothetical protein